MYITNVKLKRNALCVLIITIGYRVTPIDHPLPPPIPATWWTHTGSMQPPACNVITCKGGGTVCIYGFSLLQFAFHSNF